MNPTSYNGIFNAMRMAMAFTQNNRKLWQIWLKIKWQGPNATLSDAYVGWVSEQEYDMQKPYNHYYSSLRMPPKRSKPTPEQTRESLMQTWVAK